MVGTTPIACSTAFLNNYSCDNYIFIIIFAVVVVQFIRHYSTYKIILLYSSYGGSLLLNAYCRLI